MKQMLVFVALTAVGLILYALIAGGDGSIRDALGSVWQAEASKQMNIYP